MKEYRVVYNYKGYLLEAGQNGWIPSLEIAHRILEAKQKIMNRGNSLFLEERESSFPEKREECRICNGNRVWNSDWLYCDALHVGDLVEAEVVDNFMDCLPPACLRSDCAQVGGPCSIRIDEQGREKQTYMTFKKLDKSTWIYCGCCFRGENIERGKEPEYILKGEVYG